MIRLLRFVEVLASGKYAGSERNLVGRWIRSSRGGLWAGAFSLVFEFLDASGMCMLTPWNAVVVDCIYMD